MRSRFPEVGLSLDRERPLYAVDDSELYRAMPGEVCVHRSHPGAPIHAETNPCPEGRCLYVLDWADLRNLTHKPNGKVDRVLPSTRMPTATILRQLRALVDEEDGHSAREVLSARLEVVAETGRGLLDHATRLYPARGRAALEAVLEQVDLLRLAAQRPDRTGSDVGAEDGGASPPCAKEVEPLCLHSCDWITVNATGSLLDTILPQFRIPSVVGK
jgi:hypothetical protein